MSKKLGKLVKEARTEKGLSQAALAEQVDGLSASDVSRIERGEKEPAQAVLKDMAKVLGVTQKSLLEAASGTSAKTGSSAGKTGSSSAKASSSGKASASAGTDKTLGNLTSAEKKLVQLYRKADSGTKKAAMGLLSGEGNLVEILTPLLLGKKEVSSMASGILETLLSGKDEKNTP